MQPVPALAVTARSLIFGPVARWVVAGLLLLAWLVIGASGHRPRPAQPPARVSAPPRPQATPHGRRLTAGRVLAWVLVAALGWVVAYVVSGTVAMLRLGCDLGGVLQWLVSIVAFLPVTALIRARPGALSGFVLWLAMRRYAVRRAWLLPVALLASLVVGEVTFALRSTDSGTDSFRALLFSAIGFLKAVAIGTFAGPVAGFGLAWFSGAYSTRPAHANMAGTPSE